MIISISFQLSKIYAAFKICTLEFLIQFLVLCNHHKFDAVHLFCDNSSVISHKEIASKIRPPFSMLSDLFLQFHYALSAFYFSRDILDMYYIV